MHFLQNMKVKTKLLSSFLIMSILIAIVSITGIMSLKTVDSSSEQMYSNQLQTVQALSNIKQSLIGLQSDLTEIIYAKDNTKKGI